MAATSEPFDEEPLWDAALHQGFARSAEETPPAQLGRYVVDGELARGGLGIVYRGHDRDLDREVAVKVLKAEHARDPALRERFLAEARVCGRLQHPGIVPVYELGGGTRAPFIAMKRIDGATLAERLAARSGPSTELAELLVVLEQACQAVAYAHARGVVHRDLKPHIVV